MNRPATKRVRLGLLVHRYLGIGLGWMMVLWCLSGIVMMYAAYPRLTETQRLDGLPPIAWRGCCARPRDAGGDRRDIAGFDVEMLGSRLVLRLRAPDGSARLLDLVSGVTIDRVSVQDAQQVAAARALRPAGASPRLIGSVQQDQWTVSGAFRGDRPLYRFALEDAAATELYVSSSSGRVVQSTTRSQRFWSWLGPIPHWLYIVGLRRHVALWNAVVIWTALAGCFLTLTGLYVGIRQCRPREPSGWSPYRGFRLWHHLAGLVGGVFSLTWVASGLLSMNPWGLLQGATAESDQARLRGPPLSVAEVLASIDTLSRRTYARPLVSIQAVPFAGVNHVVVHDRDGGRLRLTGSGVVAPLAHADLAWAAQALSDRHHRAEPELMIAEDAYYFRHHGEELSLPVYRLVLKDGEGTRYYLDAVSAEILAKVERRDRAFRWLHQGLHRLDAWRCLRTRPVWDIVVLLLLSCATAGSVTGLYLGLQRLFRR